MTDQADAKFYLEEPKGVGNKIKPYPIPMYGFEYNMRHPKRGKVHIFNQYTFSKKLNLSDREGTNIDCDRCFTTFTNLGFTVEPHNNPKLEDIISVVQKESSADHSDEDCIAFVILSHGNKHGEVYSYNKPYELNLIYDYLTPEKCESLIGKPKLFFVQACRGKNKDTGFLVQSNGTETDSNGSLDINKPFSIPSYSDLFIAYSTLPGFYSYRNTKYGSPFIRYLCEVFDDDNLRNQNLLVLMTLVVQRVSINYETSGERRKLSPCFLSNLTRILNFK